MAKARAGEIELEYFTEGSGPPLLLIMGFGGSAHTWGAPFLEELASHFTVVRFSNRGTGESDRPAEQTTVEAMADDAAALLRTLGIGRAHVLGISMGGMIAQEMAIRHPQAVNGLILGCTSVGAPKAVLADPQTMAALAFDPSLPPAELIRRSWYALVSDAFADAGREFLEGIVVEMLRRPTPLDTLGKQMAAIAAFSTVGRAAGIESPTLVIHGTADRLVPPVNGEIIAAEIPGATLRMIPGAGHMFFWEQPAASAATINEFLERVPAAA